MSDSAPPLNRMLADLEAAMEDPARRDDLLKFLHEPPPLTAGEVPGGESAMALLVDASGVVISQNAAAMRNLGLALGTSIAEAAGSPEMARSFLDLIARSDAPVPLPVSKTDGRAAFLLGVRREHAGNIELTEVTRGIDPQILWGLSNALGLNRSELQTLKGVMAGKAVEEIAADLQRKPGTVRQLIKDVMAKMGVNTQQQLISIAYAMSLMVARNRPMPQFGPGAAVSPEASRGATLRVGATGKLGLHRFGLNAGVPVLLLHGAVFGISGHGPLRSAAEILGLTILAPERPGYGNTPLRKGEDPIELACAQAIELLDTLGIARAVVLCHDIGTVYAMRLAQRAPGRIAAIVAAPATPPMQGWSQTSDMPTRHRIHAWAAQNMPEIMDRFVGLGLSQIARKGVDVLPKLVFDGCDFDQGILLQPDMAMALQEAFSLAWAQEGAGFRMDMRLTNLNWQAEVARVDIPVLCLHGEESKTVSRRAVARLAADLPQGHFHPVAGAGHSLPLSHTAYILRQVLAVARDCGLTGADLGPFIGKTSNPRE